jgi:hypothetical protein
MSEPRIQSWEEFWPFYLGEHRVPLCRLLHVVGTSSGGGIAVISLATGQFWGLIVAVLIGYACSWTGHFFVEHNKPASFRYPLWSFRGDWKMVGLFWRRRLDDEMVAFFGAREPTLEEVAQAIAPA